MEGKIQQLKEDDSNRSSNSESYLKEQLIELRDYQLEIANQCVGKNALVVLPTGLGKTLIAVIVAAKTLELYPKHSKIIVLAPTRPLINQHYISFKKFLTIPEDQFDVLTGKILPDKRIIAFNEHKLLFYTPQTLRNDLVSKRYSLKRVCLIVFDEAHHSSGDYPYPMISDEYVEQNPDGNILGLTASPGASKDKITELCNSLHININNVHTRTRKDADVKTFLKSLDVYKIGVDLTELMIKVYLIVQHLLEERLQYLSKFGFIDAKGDNLYNSVIRKDLLRLNSELVKLIKGNGDKTGIYTALSINAQALILFHIIELIEQQGLDVLFNYLKKLKEDARKQNSSKAIKILSSDHRLNQIFIELLKNSDLSPEQLIHPKYKVLETLMFEELTQNPNARILVFVKLRDSVKNIVSKLKTTKNPIFRPSRFVGQTTKSKDDKGFSQKKQLEILERFKQGDLNILVSTNVGEEGLDIAECDLVIFYDIVASEIRFIQRRGRTGRHREGKVIILYCKNTHDETYMKIVLSKMKRMNINLKSKNQLEEPYTVFESKKLSLEPQNIIVSNAQAKSSRSKLDYYLQVSSEHPTLKKYEIEFSSNLPSKFGLRKKLQQDNITFEISNSEYDITIFDKVAIHIVDPNLISHKNKKLFPSWITPSRSEFQLQIFIFDFIDFKERFPEEERILKTQILELGKKYPVQIVCIDNAEELYFIVENIYEHTKKERI